MTITENRSMIRQGIDKTMFLFFSQPPLTFVEQHHNLLEGLHEVDVVVAVLLDLQQ